MIRLARPRITLVVNDVTTILAQGIIMERIYTLRTDLCNDDNGNVMTNASYTGLGLLTDTQKHVIRSRANHLLVRLAGYDLGLRSLWTPIFELV